VPVGVALEAADEHRERVTRHHVVGGMQQGGVGRAQMPEQALFGGPFDDPAHHVAFDAAPQPRPPVPAAAGACRR
jgi:hypothetical protein